jgi:hypothetical protein
MWTWGSTYITIIMPTDWDTHLKGSVAGCVRTWAKEHFRQESELAINIRKATSIEEVSPKRTYRISLGCT